jgi:transposase
VFIDESGFLLIPNVRKTWAPAGCTPILRHSYKHDKVSVIGGFSVSPDRHRFGLYVRFHAHNINGVDVAVFMRYLLRHLRKQVVLVLDNSPIHKRRDVSKIFRKIRRLHVYWLPSYAPETNPIEYVWTHGKRDLSNSAHKDSHHLGSHVRRSISRVRDSQRFLESCIKHAQLPWH